MTRETTTAVFDNYPEKYYMLTDYPPHEFMRELTTDANTLVNYILAYVINVNDNAHTVELPNFMENTLNYIVNFRAANFSAADGGIIDMNTMMSIKAQVNLVMLEFMRELSSTPFWFNHDLKFVNAGYGSTDFGMPNPSLGVLVEFGERKLGDINHGFSHGISPQILTSLEMLVLRYETSN